MSCVPSGCSFTCQLDDAAAAACTSPKTYSGLSEGPHTFTVRATHTGGSEEKEATHSWVVDLSPPSTGVIVVRAGDLIFARTPWTATHDLVQQFDLRTSGDPWSNNPIEIVRTGTIPVATADASVPTTSLSVTYQSMGDDTTPININGTYIGANHGATSLVVLTAAGHGKTVADVGSEWTASDGRKWYLMRVVSSSTLWALSENRGSGDIWSFAGSVPGSTLTHSQNATHTSTITFTAQSSAQLRPALNRQVKSVLCGTIPIVSDGVNVCSSMTLKHFYGISYPPAILAYVVSRVGSSAQPIFNDDSIADVATVDDSYLVSSNGAMTVTTAIEMKKQVKLGYVGFVQAGALAVPSNGSLWEYAPKTTNLKTPVDITSLSSSIDLKTNVWTDPARPPDRLVQIARKADGSNHYGFAVGYNPASGLGVPAVRAAAVSNAATIWTSRKQYPRGATADSTTYPGGLVAAGTILHMTSFRVPINYARYPDATVVGWYWVGSDAYLLLDFHANHTGTVALSPSLAGKAIEVVEKSSTMTLGSGVVSADGIPVTVTGGYATAVLRLH